MKPTDPNHKPKRWLRNRNDGTLYEWNEILSENALCEEIPDSMVFPAAYVNTASQAPDTAVTGDFGTELVKKKGRPKKDLGVAEMEAAVTPGPFSSADFSAEVGKGWPK
jgi:hypothetical protein